MSTAKARAVIGRLYSEHRHARALALRDAQDTQPLPGAVAFVDDGDRRALFLAEVAQLVTAKGTSWTEQHLRKVFKFTVKVARAVIQEARRELADRMRETTTELRAIASDRLEDLMRRAAHACDLDAEVKVLKEWMRLHGLYKQDEGGGDIAALIRRVSALDGPDGSTKVIDAEFSTPDDPPEVETWGAPENWEPRSDDELRGLDTPEDA